ncbi:hypothetical protein SAMN04488118_104346 [Epibacterium ulvae]|uniref:Tripartite tricarboxylate transporter TctB family protein n=1 Tax=Epibacterium ulvae TaxID=1156985 RepID=A0A1G5QM12_9RHOB|nr:hypothetical protein [Epibacterium ulvae]SCZ62179.1 hypothetical protein SAMN04488118_104346 [Epibacterium ulvae]
MLARKPDLVFAALCLIFALVCVLFWLPRDTETAMIEVFRRQISMGDAFVPIVAGTLMGICAAIHLVMTALRKDLYDTESAPVDSAAMAFLIQLTLVVALSLAVMFWAGPLAVELFVVSGSEDITYRQMRATYPYKLIGFVLGGFALVFGLSALIEGQIRASRAILALITVAILVAIFDLPLDSVLLPPNGDW